MALDEIDQMITDAGNTEVPEPKTEKARKENFDEKEYENEDDESFDPDSATIEQRKAWPKKFSNALSRRDKERAKLRAEIQSRDEELAKFRTQTPVAKPEETNYTREEQSKIDAVSAKKPNLDQYAKDGKSYGEYIEDLTEWKADLRDAKRDIADQTKESSRITAQKDAANEARIIKQAQDFLQKNPEYLEVVRENADIIDSYPPAVAQAFAEAQHPELAFVVLAETPGALEALGKMSATQAASYIGQAQAIAMQRFKNKAESTEEAPELPEAKEQKRVSGAPTPMKASRSVSGGKKSLDKMTADELAEELGF